MASPLTFSVGIPTFNQADYLEETILSLLNQTRPPDEILISDHFSTDDTPEIIAKYARHVRLIQPPPGTNLAGQYHFTLISQTCDWITLLSSDDLARPNFCEVLTRGATHREDAVLVRAGWENIDATGKSLGLNYILSAPKVELPPQTLTSQKHGPHVSFAAFALRREAYVQSGPILPSLESLSDWALFLQLTPYGPYIYENEIISCYRVGHDGNKFRDRIEPWVRDQQRIFEHVIPLAAHRAGITDLSWVSEACRFNFLRHLANACHEFTLAERSGLIPLFQPWATLAGAQSELQSFAAGQMITLPMTLSRRLRRTISPMVHKLYSHLRH